VAVSEPVVCSAVGRAELSVARRTVRWTLINQSNGPCRVEVSRLSLSLEPGDGRVASRSRIDASGPVLLEARGAERLFELPFVVPFEGLDCASWGSGHLRITAVHTLPDGSGQPAQGDTEVELRCAP
jgi:hypothetical protein